MFKDNKIATLALQLMLETRHNLYITGDAGTGKSTLLKHYLEEVKKKVAILAPTGMAAINVGGETIHSFCRLNTDPAWQLLEEGKVCKLRDNRRVKSVDVLVIDEISMVRSDMLDLLDKFFRLNKEKPRLPFGGVQLILFGDHFQLPPVLKKDEKEEFASRYKSEYFFGAKCFVDLHLKYIKLEHNYRQSEAEFIKLLNYFRYGIANSELISWVNAKFLGKLIDQKNLPITITTINKDASNINFEELEKINQEEQTYKATIVGTFGEELYPTEKYLILKQGAQVMFIKNDSEKKWVNGTIGVVEKLEKDTVLVRLNNKSAKLVEVKLSTWESYKYEYDEEKMEIVKKTVGSFVQYPLKLAWAVTIHKSQGQTFDNCIINMGRGAFIFGQTYVAFSRCRTMAGVHLTAPLKLTDIKADPAVFAFDRKTEWNQVSLDDKVGNEII